MTERLGCREENARADFLMRARPCPGNIPTRGWCAISLALAFSLAALAADKPARINLASQFQQLGYEEVELRRSGENRLYLFGRLNGRKLSVLVDSGWSFTTVSTNAASHLKLAHRLDLPPGDPFPGSNPPGAVVVLERLRLGRTGFTNQPALVQDLVFNGRPAPFQIVAGCDFLIRNSAVVDCSNRRLYTRQKDLSHSQRSQLETELRRGGFVPLDLKRTAPLALIAAAQLNGKLANLLVDTGGVWSCLDAGVATSLGLQLLPTPRRITGAGATGQRGFAVAGVRTMEVGGATFRNVNFAVMELGDWGLGPSGAALADVGGILGAPELAAGQALVDCAGMVLWLKSPTVRR